MRRWAWLVAAVAMLRAATPAAAQQEEPEGDESPRAGPPVETASPAAADGEPASEEVRRARELSSEAEKLAANHEYAAAAGKLESAVAILRRERGEHPETAEALAHLAWMVTRSAGPEQALPPGTEALAMRRRLFAGDHRDVAESLDAVAETLVALGRGVEALPLEEESVAMRRRLGPPDDPALAVSLNGLALTLHDMGRFAEALALEREAVAILRRRCAPDDPRVADLVGNEAYTLDAMSRPTEARPLHEEALRIYRGRFPGDHPEVARHAANLAHCLVLLGRAPESIPLHEEALAMRRRLLPSDHEDLAASLNNLAYALDAVGRTADAVPIYEEVVAMLRRLVGGADHPYVAGALANLANALNALGRPADALPLHEEALATYRRILPATHPLLATAVGNLAQTLGHLGRHESALPLEREAVATWSRLCPGDHPGVATALNNLAGRLHSLGRAAEAVPLQEQALAMDRRLFPGDHALVALGMDNLGRALGMLGRIDDALRYQEESLAMRRRLFGGDHPDVAHGLTSMGTWCFAAGRDDLAIEYLRQAVEMADRIGWAKRHEPLTTLGRVLLARGQSSGAIEVLGQAIDQVERLHSQAHGLPADARAEFSAEVRRADGFAVMVRARIHAGQPAAAIDALERGRGVEMRDLLESGRQDTVAVARDRALARENGGALARLDAAIDAARTGEAEVVRCERAEAEARKRADADAVRAAAAAAVAARRSLLDANAAVARLLREAVPETKPATTDELRALLSPTERMVLYQFDADGGLALLLSPTPVDGEASPGGAVRVFTLAAGGKPLTAARLETWIREAGGTLEAPGSAADAGLGELFRALVPPDLWVAIRGASTLYVVGQGASHALPFEALVVGERDGGPVFWLDEGPPVAYEASGSVLAFMRRRRAEQQAADAASILAVGDPALALPESSWPEKGLLVTEVAPAGQGAALGLRPGDVLVTYGETSLVDVAALKSAAAAGGALRIFRGGETLTVTAVPGPLGVRLDANPPPVAGPALLAKGPLAHSFRGAVDRAKGLRPLPGTRAEVEGIARAFAAAKGKATVLLGKEATEARLFEAAGAGPAYVHLATHGVADETETASFSFLALAMPAVPAPGDDGALTLADLLGKWGRRLENTGMVVLSACDTQKGRIQRHEGVFALPWGFHFAGCPTVVATLWRVSDETTPGLMEDFYRRLLARRGEGRLAALVAAKQALRKAHPDPFHWAPFVLLGDPR